MRAPVDENGCGSPFSHADADKHVRNLQLEKQP